MPIDAHAHVFLAADRSAREVSELVPAQREAPLEGFRAALDEIGAEQAVLVPLDTDDSYVAQCLAAEPERYRGVLVAGDAELGRVGVDPVGALAARLEAYPASAVRVMWLGEPGRPITDSPAWPLLQHMAETGLVMWSYLPPEQAPLLEELVVALPELRIVLNHFGFTPHEMRVDAAARPWFAAGLTPEAFDRVLRLADARQVHLMFSGQYALSHEDAPYPELAAPAARLVEAYGVERTMWGSDYPWIAAEPGYAATFDLIAQLLPTASESDRARIAGGTVAALLDFTAA